MSQFTRPLAASTSLSILLHSAVFAAFAFSPISTMPADQALAIELISSIATDIQGETEVAVKQLASPAALQERVDITTKNKQQATLLSSEKQVLVSKSETSVSMTDVVHYERFIRSDNEKKMRVVVKERYTALASSVSDAKQQQDMLQLLHNSISEKKEYPYLARRQRREGVATVGFILNPNGTIENTHLVSSSSTNTLDRAALTAVKRIEPFSPAQQYLERAEEFKVDVVFNLL